MKGSAAPERPIERGEARRDATVRPWPLARLADVCEKITDGTHRSPPNGAHGVPYVTAKNIRRFAIDLTELTFISEEHHREIYSRCDPRLGDVLYIKDGATMGIAAVNTLPYEFSLLSSVAMIRPRADALRGDFLALWLNHPDVYRGVREAQTGCAIQRMVLDQIRGMEIPLPPLAEQERIAGLLTEQLGAVERARAAAAQRLAAAEALPAALLREVFDGAEWPIVELGTGVIDLEAGTSVVAAGRPAEDDEWGVLKVSAVSWGEFRAHENKAVPPGYVPGEHERVKPGDFLISRANTAELAGAVVLVRETPGNLMLSDKTLRVVINRDVFVPEYLEFALRTRAARKFIEGNATGTSYSMRNISQPTILAIPVPTPDLPTQRRLAAELTQKLAAAEGVIARCREELAAIEALPAALLRDAFGGGRGGESQEGA